MRRPRLRFARAPRCERRSLAPSGQEKEDFDHVQHYVVIGCYPASKFQPLGDTLRGVEDLSEVVLALGGVLSDRGEVGVTEDHSSLFTSFGYGFGRACTP